MRHGHASGIVLLCCLMLASTWSAARAQKHRRENVVSCETYSLRQMLRDGTLSLEGTPAALKELGIRGIALNDMFFESWDQAYLDKIKEAVAEADGIITGVILGGNLATPDEAKRDEQIETAKERMRAAAYLGAPLVRINAGRVAEGEDDDTVGVQRVIGAFNQLLPLARELNLKITIENHGGVSRSADNIVQIIKGTDPEWVGACLDFLNWPKEPRNLRYRECQKLARYSYHVHAKAKSFDAKGEETEIKYRRVLRMLKRAKYAGALSIEFEGKSDPIEGIKKTRDLILKYW